MSANSSGGGVKALWLKAKVFYVLPIKAIALNQRNKKNLNPFIPSLHSGLKT